MVRRCSLQQVHSFDRDIRALGILVACGGAVDVVDIAFDKSRHSSLILANRLLIEKESSRHRIPQINLSASAFDDNTGSG